METYTVIGPVGGVYHVGYYGPGGKFYSAHEFVSKDSAHITAHRMNQTLAAAAGAQHGR